jgi:hypothetical protein
MLHSSRESICVNMEASAPLIILISIVTISETVTLVLA